MRRRKLDHYLRWSLEFGAGGDRDSVWFILLQWPIAPLQSTSGYIYFHSKHPCRSLYFAATACRLLRTQQMTEDIGFSQHSQKDLKPIDKQIRLFLRPNLLSVSDPKIPFLVVSYFKSILQYSTTFPDIDMLSFTYHLK